MSAGLPAKDAQETPRDVRRHRQAFGLVAAGIWLLCAGLATGAVVLLILNRHAGISDGGFRPVELTIAYTLPSVGAIVAARRPYNTIGWLLLLSGISQSLSIFTLEYARYALFTLHGGLPLGDQSAWMEQWLWCVGYGALAVGMLLFPTGRPPSSRWGWLIWLTGAAMTLYIAVAGSDYWGKSGVSLVGAGTNSSGGDQAALALVAFLALNVAGLLAVASLVVRYRQGQPVERLQLKWFIYATTLAVTLGAITNLSFLTMFLNPAVNALLRNIVYPLSFLGMAVAIMIAILRYRLYDIDILINRTMVYGSLTTLLAGVYFGCVIGMQQLVRFVSGQQTGQRPLIIVLSTLLIAALFQPLRARLQSTIDRRFYRRKYDAAKTLTAFSATLRKETDLERLREIMLASVEDTMQPEYVSMWLQTDDSRARVRV